MDVLPEHRGRSGQRRGPQAPVLRQRRDGILPTTAAALSLPGGAQPLTGTASRSVAAPELHPLVRAALDELPAADRERHLGRCPEVALLSRVLTQAGVARPGQARRAVRDAAITTRHIREDGDPRHGSFAPHCRSCAALLDRFEVRSDSAAAEPDAEADAEPAAEAPGGEPAAEATGAGDARPGAEPAAEPDDPAEAVDRALADAGWRPGRRETAEAERWADALSGHRSPQGHRHALFPAAFETWAEFGGLRLAPCGAGRVHAPRGVLVDPLRGLHWPRTLGDLGRALGSELAPLGVELGGTGLLAVDREGRVYCVDHSGDWYLGADPRSALATLLTGARPARLEPPARPS